jgi:Homeodomain-like domain
MFGFFIQLIGEEATAKLIERFGGTRLYIPHCPTPEDALAQAVGVESALKLSRSFGGERVEVPNPPPRRMRILAMRAAGHSVESIARALGCTRRRVFQVLAETRRSSNGSTACDGSDASPLSSASLRHR